MSLITLKRYLKPQTDADEFRRVVSLLFLAMGVHTAEGDPADYQKFRKDFDGIQSSYNEHTTGQDLLVLTGAAIHAFAEYGQSTARFIGQQRALLANMISMLTETMIGIGAGTEQSTKALHEIESQLARATEIDDIRELKRRLKECLDGLREEVERHKVLSQANVQHLQARITSAQPEMGNLVANGEDTDPITGLPNHSAAKVIFDIRLAAPGRKYAVIAVVNRIVSINARFGYKAGDEVLKMVAEFLRTKLFGSDILFRWTGPAFVALIEREQNMDSVRADISKFIHTQIEKTIELGGRSVMIPLSVSWSVIPVAAPLSEVVDSIETFIARQVLPETFIAQQVLPKERAQ